jgi:hypothetical protein
VIVTDPSVDVTVGVPHASVAVAVPNAASISDAEGLHDVTGGADVNVSVGGVISTVHVAVLEHVDVLPHTSLAVKVLVLLLEQLVLTTDPSLYVTVGVLQPSAAVAVPNAPSIAVAVGLHPSDMCIAGW